MQRYFGVLDSVVREQIVDGLKEFEITPLVPYEGLMAGCCPTCEAPLAPLPRFTTLFPSGSRES